MTIKYFGTSYEQGLTVTVNIYSNQGSLIYSGLPMTETDVNSGVYSSGNIFVNNAILPLGIYVARVINTADNSVLGHNEIAWDGAKEVDINTIDRKLWTEKEKMQIRDAAGIDGNKSVAKGGQLQKKSESPQNDIIDTNSFRKEGL